MKMSFNYKLSLQERSVAFITGNMFQYECKVSYGVFIVIFTLGQCLLLKDLLGLKFQSYNLVFGHTGSFVPLSFIAKQPEKGVR